MIYPRAQLLQISATTKIENFSLIIFIIDCQNAFSRIVVNISFGEPLRINQSIKIIKKREMIGKMDLALPIRSDLQKRQNAKKDINQIQTFIKFNSKQPQNDMV